MDTIDLYELYVSLVATLNTQQQGHVRPVTNFINWVNEINIELFNELADEWEKSQSITDALAIPFLKTVNIPLKAVNGKGWDLLPYPQFYARFSSARILLQADKDECCGSEGAPVMDCATGKCTAWEDTDEQARALLESGEGTREVAIKKLDNQQWGSMMKHRNLGPKIRRPYLTQFSDGFKVAPRNIGVIIFDYLKTPRKAKFAYTMGPEDTIVYDKANSVQLEWTSLVLATFIARLKKRYGSFTGQDSVYQQGELERRQTGNP